METKITSGNLKRCPFCGSFADIIKTSGSWGYSSDEIKIKCQKCWVETPDVSSEAFASGVGTFDISDKAITVVLKMWNTRDGKEDSP